MKGTLHSVYCTILHIYKNPILHFLNPWKNRLKINEWVIIFPWEKKFKWVSKEYKTKCAISNLSRICVQISQNKKNYKPVPIKEKNHLKHWEKHIFFQKDHLFQCPHFNGK